VGAVFGDTETDRRLADLLTKDSIDSWVTLGVMDVPSGRLLLFHAACAGADLTLDPAREVAVIGDGVTQALAPGRYALASVEVGLGNEALYNLVRWSPYPESASAAV